MPNDRTQIERSETRHVSLLYEISSSVPFILILIGMTEYYSDNKPPFSHSKYF